LTGFVVSAVGLAESVTGFGAVESTFTVESVGATVGVAFAGAVESGAGVAAGLLQAARATVANAASVMERMFIW
jgi:hypothetical protein